MELKPTTAVLLVLTAIAVLPWLSMPSRCEYRGCSSGAGWRYTLHWIERDGERVSTIGQSTDSLLGFAYLRLVGPTL